MEPRPNFLPGVRTLGKMLPDLVRQSDLSGLLGGLRLPSLGDLGGGIRFTGSPNYGSRRTGRQVARDRKRAMVGRKDNVKRLRSLR